VHDVAVVDDVGDPLGHPPAELGEVEAVAAAVEDALGVVDLAVPQQVDQRAGGAAHRPSPWAAAAALAAAGRASSTAWTARSSWAGEPNQHSYADGGR